MPERVDIEIAIPTHNCAPWLDHLIQSVLAQNVASSWRIVLRDDASTDPTPLRIEYWRTQLGPRLQLVENSGQQNLGMVGNYDAVLAATSARWVMFADPDDVWLPGKMDLSVRAMREAESKFGESVPLVVCSDAQVVDQDLRPLAPSYWNWSRMNPALANTFNRLLMENPVLTSTMMVNRALLDLALPMSGAASCPDWWPALVACAFGKIIVLHDRTILYRRHSANDSMDPLSAKLSSTLIRVLKSPAEPKRRVRRLIQQLSPQGMAFGDRFASRLSANARVACNAVGSLAAESTLKRRCSLVTNGLWFASPLKNIGFFLLA